MARLKLPWVEKLRELTQVYDDDYERIVAEILSYGGKEEERIEKELDLRLLERY